MFLTFRTKLKLFGRYNAYFGVRVDRRKKNAAALLAFLGCFYIMWFMIKWCFIAMCWMFYGLGWLMYIICKYIYVYPIMWVVRKVKALIVSKKEVGAAVEADQK